MEIDPNFTQDYNTKNKSRKKSDTSFPKSPWWNRLPPLNNEIESGFVPPSPSLPILSWNKAPLSPIKSTASFLNMSTPMKNSPSNINSINTPMNSSNNINTMASSGFVTAPPSSLNNLMNTPKLSPNISTITNNKRGDKAVRKLFTFNNLQNLLPSDNSKIHEALANFPNNDIRQKKDILTSPTLNAAPRLTMEIGSGMSNLSNNLFYLDPHSASNDKGFTSNNKKHARSHNLTSAHNKVAKTSTIHAAETLLSLGASPSKESLAKSSTFYNKPPMISKDSSNKINFTTKMPSDTFLASKFQNGNISSIPTLNKKKAVSSLDSKCCHCKKSRCLKLYCECFARQAVCNSNCQCVDCLNINNSTERHSAIRAILEKHPNAFETGELSLKKQTKCHCKKSFCLKKYCECYQRGSYCTLKCHCIQCKNHAPHEATFTPIAFTNTPINLDNNNSTINTNVNPRA